MDFTRRRATTTSNPIQIATVLLLAHVLAGVPAARPMEFLHPGAQDRSSADGQGFSERLEAATELIRQQTLDSPTCHAYFRRHGADLDRWLTPDLPPYVVLRSLDAPFSRQSESICGAAQNRAPFEVLFIDPSCFRGRGICDLASLLLHEMGHLARRDTSDQEPPDFFIACRLSRCVDPSRYD